MLSKGLSQGVPWTFGETSSEWRSGKNNHYSEVSIYLKYDFFVKNQPHNHAVLEWSCINRDMELHIYVVSNEDIEEMPCEPPVGGQGR